MFLSYEMPIRTDQNADEYKTDKVKSLRDKVAQNNTLTFDTLRL
jgi:hypothetical protein